MERGRRSRRQKQLELTDEDGGDMSDTGGEEDEHMEDDAVDVLRSGFKDIVKEIQDFKTE